LIQHALLLSCQCALQKKDAAGVEQKESLLQLLVQNVLKNPYIWGMALTYFFIYVVRQGVTSWFVFYLMQVWAIFSLLVHESQIASQFLCGKGFAA
jgi:sugar phosphate permease